MICNPEYDSSSATQHKLTDIIHKVKDVLTDAMENLVKEQEKEWVKMTLIL